MTESKSGQDKADPAFWFATWADKTGPISAGKKRSRDFPVLVLQEKVLSSAI